MKSTVVEKLLSSINAPHRTKEFLPGKHFCGKIHASVGTVTALPAVVISKNSNKGDLRHRRAWHCCNHTHILNDEGMII